MTNQAFTSTPSPGGGEVIRCNECRGKAGSSPAYPRTEADVKHMSTCSLFKSAAQLDREIDEPLRDQELKDFAADVRRTGLTKGRDQDVADAVSKGYLSMSDAMNTDD